MADPASVEYVYTNEEFDELARTVDQAKTGRINYLSFLGLFSAAEAAGAIRTAEADATKSSPLLSRPPAENVFTEPICATIWAHTPQLLKSLRSSDPKATGAVGPQDFAKALTTMNNSVSSAYTSLSAGEVEKVVGSLPLDGDGKINYTEFVAAFEVRDKLQEA